MTEQPCGVDVANNINLSLPQNPELKPLKSALYIGSQNDNENRSVKNDSKLCIKRTVTFIPGLISGKSDVLQIESDADDNNNNNSNNNNNNNNNNEKLNDFLFDDVDDTSNDSETNFLNWRWGNNTFSGSETSDDEKNFNSLNEKYKTWSPQYMKNEQRKKKMENKLNTSIRKLHQTKEHIKNLRVQIENDGDLETENNENSNKKYVKRGRIRRGRKTIENNIENGYKKWRKKQNKKGVIYISSVPFGCTNVQLKKIFGEFGVVTNVHLEAAKGENGKVKKIHNKWTEFCEGWVEFKDKKIAKQVVEILNETKIPKKYVKNRLAKNHIWNMKYLKGFGWHHLEEYKQTVRTLQRKKYEIKIADAHRQSAHFESQVAKAKEMMKGINNNKNNNKDSVMDEDNNESNFEPPLKKRKIVKQRVMRKRRNHSNKQVMNKLIE